MNRYSNEQIVDGLRGHDKEIMRSLYDETYDLVERMVLSNSGCTEEARDLFHEVLIIMFDTVKDKGFVLRSTFSTYIYGIAKNKWMNKLRKRKISGEVVLDMDLMIEEDVDYHEEEAKTEKWKLVVEEMNKLSSACQKILNLLMNDLSLQKVTQLMGYSSVQHTKNRRYRCKKTLMKQIMNNPKYKELKNEFFESTGEIPRW